MCCTENCIVSNIMQCFIFYAKDIRVDYSLLRFSSWYNISSSVLLEWGKMFFCQVSINGPSGGRKMLNISWKPINRSRWSVSFFLCVLSCLLSWPYDDLSCKSFHFRDSVNVSVLKSSLRCRELLHCCLVLIKD